MLFMNSHSRFQPFRLSVFTRWIQNDLSWVILLPPLLGAGTCLSIWYLNWETLCFAWSKWNGAGNSKFRHLMVDLCLYMRSRICSVVSPTYMRPHRKAMRCTVGLQSVTWYIWGISYWSSHFFTFFFFFKFDRYPDL